MRGFFYQGFGARVKAAFFIIMSLYIAATFIALRQFFYRRTSPAHAIPLPAHIRLTAFSRRFVVAANRFAGLSSTKKRGIHFAASLR